MINKEIAEEAKKYALAEIEKFGVPNVVHFELSETKGIELAEKFGVDKDVVKVGTYFMDLKLGQAFQEKRMQQHIQMSVDAAEEFFKKFSIDKITKDKIINCIAAHHGAVPYKYKEAEICANADCYRFLHPKGFFAFWMAMGKRGLNFSEILKYSIQKVEEKYKILSLDVCKKELTQYYQAFKKFIKDAGET